MSKLARYQNSIWSEVSFTLLAVASVGLLVYEFSADLAPNTVSWLYGLDTGIALIFLLDFLIGLRASSNKAAYWKQNWYLLIASIPISEGLFQALRALRFLRLVRIIRVIARLRRLTVLAEAVSGESSRYIHMVIVVATVILSGAAAMFTMEADINPNINNFFDAIWWATVTATTVGYGDIYPLTWEGRLVAMVLMFFGIGLVGAVAGIVGATMLKGVNKKR